MSIDDVIDRESVVTEDGPERDEFLIEIGDKNLSFRTIKLADPVPTAEQIIDAAGFRPAEDYLVFKVTPQRRLKELDLDHTTNLRGRRKERFLIFKSDRSWRGMLERKRFEWGARKISGSTLKWMAKVDSEKYGVWLEREDEPDLLIGNNETASLSPKGVEKFRIDLLIRICIEDEFFPWPRKTIKTEEIAELGGWDVSQGVIEVDKDQNERNLEPGEEITLRPGLSFGKKFCFKRG
tara:strand:+ start:4191 stop:4901 length:711 start_codon:yes stop_codon:yes gene_type:complete